MVIAKPSDDIVLKNVYHCLTGASLDPYVWEALPEFVHGAV
jgi:hypothetical protein